MRRPTRAARRDLRLMAIVLAAALAVGAWLPIAPRGLPASALAEPHVPDLANGEVIFNAGNCAGCHQTPGQDDRALLGGGLRLPSPFGAFVAPNISPDPKHGVGAWTEAEFVNATQRGVGRRGEHLYPAFPYPQYGRLSTADVRDLFAYLRTLPPAASPNADHEIPFPFSIRAAVGVWKLLYFRPLPLAPDPTRSAAWNRGAYLVEGAAHCASCHTPRDALGGEKQAHRYAGAPNLEEGGRFASNISQHADGIGDWTEQEIAEFLKTGVDRCFNEPMGMRGVLASTARLPDADLAAMATYLKALPARPGNARHKTC